MVGDTEGIETDYKRIVNGKREIPISSCPSYVEEFVYGGNPSSTDNPEENLFFQTVIEKLDQKAEKLTQQRKKISVQKAPPLSSKISKIKKQIGIL